MSESKEEHVVICDTCHERLEYKNIIQENIDKNILTINKIK